MNMFNKTKEKIDEDYLKKGITKVKDDDIELAAKNQEEIEDKIVNANALKKYSELGKVMFGMIKDYRRGIYSNVPWFTMAAIGFALLYVLNPLDIMPDFIPGLGYVDDFAILTITLRFIETDLHKYLDWKLEE